MFKSVPVEVSNGNDYCIKSHPVSIGVPFPEGAVSNQACLQLMSNGQPVQFNTTQLANWPDGSIKWLLLDFQADVGANDESLYQLESDNSVDKHFSHAAESRSIVIRDVDDGCLVDTGSARFTINKKCLILFNQVVLGNNKLLSDVPASVQLVDEHGDQSSSIVTSISYSDLDNRFTKKVTIDGYFQSARGESLADFKLHLTFYAGLPTVKCEFTLLNPRAAKHPGGVWDLGDKGSFFFKELVIKIQLAQKGGACESSIRMLPETDWRSAKNKSLTLEQNSSGGENWKSGNHMDFAGEIPLEYKGFRYSEEGAQVASGNRATPSVHLASGEIGITAHIKDFWQNFPKAIAVDKGSLLLSLFPANDSNCYELQGGERKKHTFYLDFSNNKASLDPYINELIPRIPLQQYCAANVIPWLPRHHEDSIMQQLIDRGIQGENNFFDKRETIDEFGWRNFGEIFADHEQLEYKGKDELISHYNNQYDPLCGFIKQYIVSGDGRWYELLSQLAQHIVDIDIYHTDKDRDEYNDGLFWHTHHYLSAYTCTHRTFSRWHEEDFLYGKIGGGPGAQHCYTTGLSYYYFMTGDEVYKDAALQLVTWVTRVLEGSGAVVERLFQFKSKDLPILKRLISGETIQRYKYPFTRGTGNYITALIDAYNLTGERHYLLSVEKVISQSVHPGDDITLRNLEDIEAGWSYLIYLQAVCKYLELKTSLQEVDEASVYARDSLLHYVDWMLENESPFLSNAERLEYPNHTWTAQDLRKASLFYVASLYSRDKKSVYLKAAHFYVRFVEETLVNEDTRHYSRILILLMQNYIHEPSLDYNAAKALRDASNSIPYPPPPLYNFSGVLIEFFRDISCRVLRMSFKNERRWLSFRVS